MIWSDLSLFYNRDNSAYNVLEGQRFLLEGTCVRISLSPPLNPSDYAQVPSNHWGNDKIPLHPNTVEYGQIGFVCSAYVLDGKNRNRRSDFRGDSPRTGHLPLSISRSTESSCVRADSGRGPTRCQDVTDMRRMPQQVGHCTHRRIPHFLNSQTQRGSLWP